MYFLAAPSPSGHGIFRFERTAANRPKPQSAKEPQPSPTSDNSPRNATLKTSEREISKMQLTPYLLFAGNCKDAMTFYHAVFGGDLTMTSVGDSPMKNVFPASMHSKIVSARLKSKLVDISASDWLRPSLKPIRGNTVCLYLSGGNADDTKMLFNMLSEGADVSDPLSDQPFGLYGALNDKFGNRWMFHSEKK
jgi:PhnB protein